MGLLSHLRSTFILGYMFSICWMRRSPSSLIYLFSTPFTLLFLLYLIVGKEFLPFALVGTLVMVLVQSGAVLTGDGAWYRLELKFQDMMMASPLPSWGYMMGLAMAELLFSSPALAILAFLLGYTGLAWDGALPLILACLLTWVLLSSLGFLLSTVVPNIRNAWELTVLLGMVFSVLPPVFYPLEVIPATLRPFALIVPTTHSALLMREAVGVPWEGWNTVFSWLVLIIYTVFLIALLSRKASLRK